MKKLFVQSMGRNTMSFFPDMGSRLMVASGDHIRAIGWLHQATPSRRASARVARWVQEDDQNVSSNEWAANDDDVNDLKVLYYIVRNSKIE